jgi:hypothetical protein
VEIHKKPDLEKKPLLFGGENKSRSLGDSVYSIHYILNFHPWSMNLVKIS